jgi:hypothetical protein
VRCANSFFSFIFTRIFRIASLFQIGDFLILFSLITVPFRALPLSSLTRKLTDLALVQRAKVASILENTDTLRLKPSTDVAVEGVGVPAIVKTIEDRFYYTEFED